MGQNYNEGGSGVEMVGKHRGDKMSNNGNRGHYSRGYNQGMNQQGVQQGQKYSGRMGKQGGEGFDSARREGVIRGRSQGRENSNQQREYYDQEGN
jgi:hypothetical protein